MNLVWQFLQDNWELIATIVGGLSIAQVAQWLWAFLKKQRQLKIPIETFPFDVLPPRTSSVVRLLLLTNQDKADPLADFNIPYQPRLADYSVRRELERRLEQTGWLLILGRAGIGKTREAAELAHILNKEGWTVLKLTDREWLDAPARFPKERIGTDRKLLFFLDDLNQSMDRSRRREISPRADDPSQPIRGIPLQERLLRTLEFYEGECRSEEIRVIATARNETEADQLNQPSEWEKLQVDKYPKLWRRFEQYVLPEPDDQAIVNVLKETVEDAGIPANVDDYQKIAKYNDRTFRNIIENLVKARERNIPLTLQTFEPILKRTWSDRYRSAVKKAPMARYLYDAVDLLQQVNVTLQPLTILAVAELLIQEKLWHRFWYRWQLHKTLNFLTRTERILEPRSGQIEAKDYTVELKKYIAELTSALLKLSKTHPQTLLSSLFNIADEALDQQWYSEALMLYDQIVQTKPDYEEAWSNRGIVLYNLKRYEEAIASYDQVLKLNPERYLTWDAQGIAFSKLKQYEKALKTYDKALAINPSDSNTLYNRGVALCMLKLHPEAIESWHQASITNPQLAPAFFNQACIYAIMGNVNAAIENLKQAIALNPDKYRAKAESDSDFDSIRLNQEFQALVRSVKESSS